MVGDSIRLGWSWVSG